MEEISSLKMKSKLPLGLRQLLYHIVTTSSGSNPFRKFDTWIKICILLALIVIWLALMALSVDGQDTQLTNQNWILIPSTTITTYSNRPIETLKAYTVFTRRTNSIPYQSSPRIQSILNGNTPVICFSTTSLLYSIQISTNLSTFNPWNNFIVIDLASQGITNKFNPDWTWTIRESTRPFGNTFYFRVTIP